MLNTVVTTTTNAGTLVVAVGEGSSSSTLPNNDNDNKMDNQHHVHEFVSLYESLTDNERCHSKQLGGGVQHQQQQQRQRQRHRSTKQQQEQEQEQLDGIQPRQQQSNGQQQQQYHHRFGIQQQQNEIKEGRSQQHIDNLDCYNDDDKFEHDINGHDNSSDCNDQVVVFNKYYYNHHIIYDNSDDDEIIFESIDEIDNEEDEELTTDHIDNHTTQSWSSTSYDAGTGTGGSDQSLFSNIRHRMTTKLIESEDDEEKNTTTPLQLVEEEESITDHDCVLSPTNTTFAVQSITKETIHHHSPLQQEKHPSSIMISPLEDGNTLHPSLVLNSTSSTIVSFELNELVYNNNRDDDDTNAALSASTIFDSDRSYLSVPLPESPKNYSNIHPTDNASTTRNTNNNNNSRRLQMAKNCSVSALSSSKNHHHRDIITKSTMKKMKSWNKNNTKKVDDIHWNNTKNVSNNNNSHNNNDYHIEKKATAKVVGVESNGTVTTSSITADINTTCSSQISSMVGSSSVFQQHEYPERNEEIDDDNSSHNNTIADQSNKLLHDNDSNINCSDIKTIIEITPRFTKMEMQLRQFDPIISMSVSPQVYLDTMLHLRGYSTERYKALSTAYHNQPSILQECSYSQYILNKVNKNDIRTLRTLFTKYGLSMNPANYYGTSLIHDVCSIGNVDCLTMLLEIGCDIRIANCMGRTPLHEVCKPKRNNNNGCYNWLLNKTTTKEQQKQKRQMSFSFEIIELIMKHDIRLFYIADQNGKLPLERIAKQYWIDMKTFLESVKDTYWPNRHFIKYGEEPSPPLTSMYPNTRPLTNPKRIKFSPLIKKNKKSYYETIYNIANGEVLISEKNHNKSSSSLSFSSRQYSTLCDESARSHSEACYSVTSPCSDTSSVMSYSGSVISSDDDNDIIGGAQRGNNKIKSRTGNDIIVSPPKSERSTYGSYRGPSRNNSWRKAMNDSDHNQGGNSYQRNHLLRHQSSWRRKQSVNIMNRLTNNVMRNSIGNDNNKNHQSDNDIDQINKSNHVNDSDHNMNTSNPNPNDIPMMITIITIDRPVTTVASTTKKTAELFQSNGKLQQQQQLGNESQQGSISSRKNRISQRSFQVECFDNL